MKKVKSKKFKDDVPEIPFLYDFYLIYWEDIQSDSSWKEMDDIQKISKLTESYEKQFANPFVAAQKGFVDDIIEPKTTRKRVIKAFASLKGKKIENPWKKHDNIPL